jgi:integrase
VDASSGRRADPPHGLAGPGRRRWSKPYSAKQLRTLVKKAQFEAGLEATGNIHILRHTFCTRLAMKGQPPRTIQELAGHKHITTTNRYMHVVKGAKEAAIAKLNTPLPTGLSPTEEGFEFGRILADSTESSKTPVLSPI